MHKYNVVQNILFYEIVRLVKNVYIQYLHNRPLNEFLKDLKEFVQWTIKD